MKSTLEVNYSEKPNVRVSDLENGTLFYHPDYVGTRVLMRTNNKEGVLALCVHDNEYPERIGGTYNANFFGVRVLPKGACVHLVQE